MSTQVIGEIISGDNRYNLTSNVDKKYALENIVNTIHNVKDIGDEDIIILLDGDDWLSNKKVLSHLELVYNNNNCSMTYGSYAFFPFKNKGVEPSEYPKHIIENNLYRKDIWRASHLRTFKYKLWKKLNLDDLRYNGSYLRYAYDQAVMLPLLEMSRDNASYIKEVMHVYNRSNPLNVDKVKRTDQEWCARYVRGKEPYEYTFV
jgi:hypothetical protein